MPDLVAPLAIKTFAGIRTGELVELTWDRVGSKKIEIRGSKSKSRRSRPVTLPDNLIQWLDGRRQTEGPVAGTDSAFTWCDRMSKLAALAGISLPHKTRGTRTNYPSGVSDEEWAFCAPYLTLMEDAPQRDYSMRAMFNAVKTHGSGRLPLADDSE